MPLSQKTINEYKQILKEDYNLELDDKEANEQLVRLVNFYTTLIEINYEDKQQPTTN